MPSDAAARLRDIEYHIDLATQFVAELDYEAFRADTRTVYAVIRCLEIVSEASRRLPDEMKRAILRFLGKTWREPGMCTVTIMRTSLQEWFWDTVQMALPPLRAAIASELAHI